ncbi:MAG: GMP synthase (glutamine-hydrolyzing) [Myxococcota bacterium]|jgi:GMP synthase (glutamine-hydrolysing)
MRRHIVVIDPGTKFPELHNFNRIARASELPATYHLPSSTGSDSLRRMSDNIAGIVIFGSGASVHDNDAWQHEMDEWLLPKVEEGIPVLGLCYGHQHLAHRLGGTVGAVREDNEKIRGLRTTHLLADRLWGEACSGPVIVSHRDMVTALPPGFVNLGHREHVPIDAFGHPTRPIWGFQPHPEATTAFTTNNGIPFDGDPNVLAFGHRLVDVFVSWCAAR